jgi:hypothetical protein
VSPSVRKKLPHGPRSGDGLGGIGLAVEDPRHARSVFDSFGLRAAIHEEDMAHVTQLAVQEDGIKHVVEEGEDALVAGWVSLIASFFYPCLELWSLYMARIAWRDGRRVHSVAITALGVYLLSWHIVMLATWGDPPLSRFRTGAILTLLLFSGLGIGALRARRRATG